MQNAPGGASRCRALASSLSGAGRRLALDISDEKLPAFRGGRVESQISWGFPRAVGPATKAYDQGRAPGGRLDH